jgi:hypothetical protein
MIPTFSTAPPPPRPGSSGFRGSSSGASQAAPIELLNCSAVGVI